MLVGRFDDKLGALRINDLAYEKAEHSNELSYKQVSKLYGIKLSEFAKCKANGQTTCTINVDGEQITYNLKTISSNKECLRFGLYNREIQQRQNYCSETEGGEFWVSQAFSLVDDKDLKNKDGSYNCENSVYGNCSSNGDYYEAIKRQCAAQGGRLGTIAEIGALYVTNQLPSLSGFYWTSEEYSSDRAYFVNSTGTTGGGSGGEKVYLSNRNFVCLGNE